MTPTPTLTPVPYGTIVRYHGTIPEHHGDYVVVGYRRIPEYHDPQRGLILAPVDSDGGISQPHTWLRRVHVGNITPYHPAAVDMIWPNGIDPLPTPTP